MARKKPSFSTVVALMSDNAQARMESEAARPEQVDTLPLTEILPDFSQPRHLLPAELADSVAGGQQTPQEIMADWLARANRPTADTALRHNMRELIRLADSIEQHGLINPVSVRPPRPDESLSAGVNYVLVTGERRYWAHVYLAHNNKQIKEGEVVVSPAQIKVTIAAPGIGIKAHQLIENLMRENINAVERARGFWALRYEMSGVNDSSLSTGIESEDDDSDSQTVNDSSPKLVTWAEVERVMGLSKRYRIFVTSVLNLCEEAQTLVTRHNLPEMTIRPIVQKLKKYPELQVRALKQLIDWQAENEASDGAGRPIVASVKALVEQLLAEETAEPPAKKEQRPTRAVSSEPVIRFRDKVRQTLDFLNRLKEQDRSTLNTALQRNEYVDVIVDLRNLRQQIDTILETANTGPIEPLEPPNAESNTTAD